MTKIQLKRVNHKLSRRTVDAPSTGRFCEASSGPEKSLVPHGLVEKKKRQTSWIVENLFLEATNLKTTNTTDLEKDLQRLRLRRSTEVDVNTLRRSIELFFFSFSTSSNNLRFAFLALKVASQAFTWNISICSAKINHALRCSLSRELATGRARLRTAFQGAASQLQLTEPQEQRVAQCGLCAQAWKSELISSPGPAILLHMRQVDGDILIFGCTCTFSSTLKMHLCSK